MMEHVPQRCEIYELPTGPMPENGSSPVPKSDDTAGHVDAEILSINPFHSDTRPGMISFALWYVLVMKWHVIPLHTVDDEGRCTCGNDECTSAGKHPRIARWQKKASDDPARIREWWERWPDANIGILTGKPTGLLVVDVDPRNDGDISFDQLESEGKKIPGTVECHTGGGGRHYYLRRPEGNARFPQKLAEGIDLKCDDGYVVAPPSRHRSGEEYVWEVSSIPGEETIADTPGWTIDHRETNDRPQKESGEELSVIPEGRRNLTLTSMAGVLRRQGLSKEAIIEELLEINGRRCRPPLSDAEVRTIAGSIVKHSPSPDERVVPDVVLPPEAESQGHDEPAQGRAAVYKAADLATMEFEEVRMLVPEFLPEGVSLLAAAPKTGKSWFVLDLAYSVASGASFLDYPAVDPGPVVYFALEDTQRRMQDRFTKLLGTGFQIPLNLEVVHNWPRLDKGGNDELRLLVEDISPRLIIVDTYVKLKRPQRVGRSIYEED
ncbi:MAG: bifunctional DNA primase/polymerase [Bacteroidetes bacterium]|nr:bifunctional DNA primase/polymerase [Bacteroidota bacterium]